jgi:hypothetical protein
LGIFTATATAARPITTGTETLGVRKMMDDVGPDIPWMLKSTDAKHLIYAMPYLPFDGHTSP